MNPAKHSKEQVSLLSKIITAHGIRWPITVSKQSGFIVSGHCRRDAAITLGVKKYPVCYQDFKSDAEELAVLVADNQIQELSEIDSQKMSDILKELKDANYDLELTAVDVNDLEAADVDDIQYIEEEIRPYQRTHILLSFEPRLLLQVQPHLENILKIEGVEYEQASN